MITISKRLARLTLRSLLFLALCFAFTAAISTGNLAPTHAQSADATANYPSIILIIRHAEKPPKDDKSPDLIPAGFARAQHLPALFLGPNARFPRPDVLFATHVSKHSNRPVETITPLSAALHLPISHNFDEDEVQPLAKEILSGKYAGKVVLICWHHGKIPALADAFGIQSAPTWSDDVFNRVWEIQWSAGQPKLAILQQALMPGDPAN